MDINFKCNLEKDNSELSGKYYIYQARKRMLAS